MTDMKKRPKISRSHSTHKKRRSTADSEAQLDHAAIDKSEEEQPAISRSRRSFLGKVTAAAVAASVLGIPKLIHSQTSTTDTGEVTSGGTITSTSCITGCDIELQ